MNPPRTRHFCLGAGSFAPAESVEEMIDEAAAVGFEAVELSIEATGSFRFDTPLENCRRWADRAASAGLRVACVHCTLTPECNLGCDCPDGRRCGRERLIAALARAGQLGASCVSVAPAFVGAGPDEPPLADYADALHFVYKELYELAATAERLGAAIGVVPAVGRFLLSPIETRQFLDRINSPSVGAALDLPALAAVGYPQQWIATLGQRTLAVRVGGCEPHSGPRPGGKGLIDWPAVQDAMERVYYGGPIIVSGALPPADVLACAREMLG